MRFYSLAEGRQRIFQLYAYENQTFDGIIQELAEEARVFRPSTPKFPRSSVYNFLRDRAYIGELEFKGNWCPGKHKPIIDRVTWDRVQRARRRKSLRDNAQAVRHPASYRKY